MYLFSNVLGVFVFDDKLNKVDEILFKTFEDSQNKKNLIEKMKGGFAIDSFGKNLVWLNGGRLPSAIFGFKKESINFVDCLNI